MCAHICPPSHDIYKNVFTLLYSNSAFSRAVNKNVHKIACVYFGPGKRNKSSLFPVYSFLHIHVLRKVYLVYVYPKQTDW